MSSQQADFQSEWKTRIGSKHGIKLDNADDFIHIKTNTKALLAVGISESGIASIQTILHAQGRAYPILFEFPNYEQYKLNRGEVKAFVQSIDLKKGQIARDPE